MDIENIVLPDVYERWPPARHRQDNSTLYLIGKVALFALCLYCPIVPESPILAAFTVLIGASILYDLFCMACEFDRLPGGRGDTDYRTRIIFGQNPSRWFQDVNIRYITLPQQERRFPVGQRSNVRENTPSDRPFYPSRSQTSASSGNNPLAPPQRAPIGERT